MGRHSSSPPLSFALKKAPEAGLGAFVAKQENLRGTGRLHALVHVFVSRSDAKAELEETFRGMGGRLCRRIGYFAFCTGM